MNSLFLGKVQEFSCLGEKVRLAPILLSVPFRVLDDRIIRVGDWNLTFNFHYSSCSVDLEDEELGYLGHLRYVSLGYNYQLEKLSRLLRGEPGPSWTEILNRWIKRKDPLSQIIAQIFSRRNEFPFPQKGP